MSLRALARFCYRRRRLVVLGWVLALVGVSVLSGALGTNFTTNFSAPNTESTKASNLLAANFKAQSGDSVQVVMQGTPSMRNAAVERDAKSFIAALERIPHVANVGDPFATPGGISKSGTVALANAQLDAKSQDVPDSVGRQMITLAEKHSTGRLEVRLGGQLIQQSERPSLSGEGIGLIAAILILLIAFGSVLAMVLPIVVALAGIAVGLAIIGLLTHVYPLQSFSTTLATMIGIGVGIDYALFVVTRYRQGLHAGLDPEEAVITAVDTSGRAVLFAGLTVIIALLGMLAIGLSFISGLGIGAAAVVAVTVLSAVTLLPAMLGFVGTNIDRFALPWLHNDGDGSRETIWHRWSRYVQRHAALLTVVGLAVVIALALPVLSLRLGFVDAGNDPAGTQSREAYDLVAKGFGPGSNGPFLVAVQLPAGGNSGELAKLHDAMAKTPGVASVSPATVSPSGTTAVIRVNPTTSPQDVATSHLLHRLRGVVIPAAIAGTGAKVYVGGFNALTDDFANLLGQRLPLFIAVVIILSFLLLMAVFRSILVPLKAAIMNLLSIGAAYGVIVMIFQFGWGKDLVGVGKEGPIQAFLPIMMFAILFGLSMDYEVFLLSRIREEYMRTGNNSQAVSDGLSATARVITAAAAIMCTFFLSFVLGDNIIIKLFGIGFASAIFIDATLIRMVIVPSTMALLGDANWWLPKWLDRILPHLDVEGPALEPHPPVAPDDGQPVERGDVVSVP
ncbi:MAG: putative drug exporter of the superfamily [Actinomycetota bacterium]|jgi:RND superfamily putative drug exporter|nr:putative drug exporter of the superfamily [Actinomycetota bacterium]